MLTDSQVQQVKHLLSEGTPSQRQVAVEVGTTRGTVQRIAKGEYRPRQRNVCPVPVGAVRVRKWRCPGCGGMSTLDPCQKCLLEDGVVVGRERNT